MSEKQVDLGGGKAIVIKPSHFKGRFVIRGAGMYASLTSEQARALYSALRQFDNEGLLED